MLEIFLTFIRPYWKQILVSGAIITLATTAYLHIVHQAIADNEAKHKEQLAVQETIIRQIKEQKDAEIRKADYQHIKDKESLIDDNLALRAYNDELLAKAMSSSKSTATNSAELSRCEREKSSALLAVISADTLKLAECVSLAEQNYRVIKIDRGIK